MNQDLDRLWSGVPVGTPDLAGAVRRGDRARRTRQGFGAIAATAVLLVGSVVGGSWWRPAEAPDPAPAVPSAGGRTATLYYLMVEPAPEGKESWSARKASLLTPRQVEVADTGDPAYDALHHLMSAQAPAGLESAVMQPRIRAVTDLTIDVVGVTHRDGLVVVELTRDPYDPCPVCGMIMTFRGESVAQAWAMTVRDALGTDDPVSFVADGDPVAGVWGARIDDPLDPAAGRDLVVPSDDELPVATATRSLGSGGVEESGELEFDDGCARVGGRAVLLPEGWSAWAVQDRIVLLDGEGRIVASAGQQVAVDGTTFDGPGRETCLADGNGLAVSTLSFIR